MQKLCKDLKNFGYSNWKNIKIESIMNGFGDQVCDIITELINLELYRKDFKFLPPTFPEDEQEDDDNLDGVTSGSSINNNNSTN